MTPIHKKNSEANEEKASSPRSRRYKTITPIVIALLLFPLGYFIYSYYQAKEEENIRIAAKIESERIAKEEAERKAKAEAERHAKEEAERRAKAEAERIAKEESERKAKAEAERVAKEEAERKAKAEAERIAKEEAERKAKAEAERLAKVNSKEKRRKVAKLRNKKSDINIDLIDTPDDQRALAIEYLEYQNITPEEYGAYMIEACKTDDWKLLINILGAGADVNEQDENGKTALHYAVMKLQNSAYFTAILLDAGADVNISDNDGYTPLHSVFMSISPYWEQKVACLKLLLSCPDIDVNKTSKKLGTPLHIALNSIQHVHSFYDFEILLAKLLLAAPGIDANIADNDGDTPLHKLAGRFDSFKNADEIELVELLISTPHINVNKTNTYGKTPLAVIVSNLISAKDFGKSTDHYDIAISILIKAGADVNNASKSSLLHQVVQKDLHESLRLLLSAQNVDVNKVDDNLGTALYLAAMRGSKECVKLLLKTPGIDVNKGRAFMTPYSAAVNRGHKEVAELIRVAGGK